MAAYALVATWTHIGTSDARTIEQAPTGRSGIPALGMSRVVLSHPLPSMPVHKAAHWPGV